MPSSVFPQLEFSPKSPPRKQKRKGNNRHDPLGENNEFWKDCGPECNGTGKVVIRGSKDNWVIKDVERPCPLCEGSGNVKVKDAVARKL
jgi:DnaJ-class molecular chaperone